MPTKPTTSLAKKEPDGFLKISLNLTLGIGITTFISALALIVVHFGQPKYRDSLNFVVTTLATAAGISTAVYALRGIEISLEDKKIDRTLHYIQVWNDPSYFGTRKIAAEIHKELKNLDPIQCNDYINKLYGDADKKQEIANILNFLEEMSMCVHLGVLDEKVLKDFYRYIVHTYCDNFKLFVDISRQEKKNPNLYINLTDLCKRWRG